MSFLLAARAFASRLPREVWYAIGVAIALWFLYSAGHSAGEREVRAEWAEVERLALERAQEADAAALETITETTNNVEASNDEAQAAADSSDDPLRSAFDSLRD